MSGKSFADWLDEQPEDNFGLIETHEPLKKGEASEPEFIEKCPGCDGSGEYKNKAGRVTGVCYKCKGKGNKRFKTSAETREKGAAQRYRTKINAAARMYDLERKGAAMSEAQRRAAQDAIDTVAREHAKTNDTFRQADAWLAMKLAHRTDLTPVEQALCAHLARLYRRYYSADLFAEIFPNEAMKQ